MPDLTLRERLRRRYEDAHAERVRQSTSGGAVSPEALQAEDEAEAAYRAVSSEWRLPRKASSNGWIDE